MSNTAVTMDLRPNLSDETVPLSNDRRRAIEYGSQQERETSYFWSDFERRRGLKSDDLKTSSRNQWLSLVFGQGIALLAASQGAASFTLEYGLGQVFPSFLMLTAYVPMSLHLLYSNEINSAEQIYYYIPLTKLRIRLPWWYYCILSVFDIAPNYLTLLALKHTSLTSSTLLGSLTAPSIMLSSYFLLRKVYRPAHFVGVALCLTGGLLTVFMDRSTSNHVLDDLSIHPHSYYGDILSICAALLYGVGDSLGEFWCKHVDRKEYLGMLGFFGSIYCLFFVLLFERNAVISFFEDLRTTWTSIVVIALYAPLLILYYISASLFLVTSDATLLNLSLQSSNFWAICFSVEAFHEAPSITFYIALLLVVSGVFVYELCGNSVASCSHHEDTNHSDTEAPIDKDSGNL